MAIFSPKTPELSSKLYHYKLTIKLLGGKLEELKNKKSEEGSSESEGSRDFVKQMQMIEKAIEEQKEKEALKQVEVQQEKQREDNLKEQKQNEGIEVFEILLREDELKKMQKFCEDNFIKISAPKELSAAEKIIAEILRKGPGSSRSNSSEHQL